MGDEAMIQPEPVADAGGYVVVPREPTGAMRLAFLQHTMGGLAEEVAAVLGGVEGSQTRKLITDAWRAMIAAAPPPPVADAGGVVERLEQMMERLDAAHPGLPARDPDASTVDEAVEVIQSLLAQVESLRLAICGGEDAPGYAASLTHEQVLQVAADNLVAMRQANELAWDGETGQSWKSRALKAEAERDDLQAEAGTQALTIRRLTQEREELQDAFATEREAKARMVEALERAERWFRDYERQHRAKGTPEGNLKADTNEERANYCRAALTGDQP